MSTTVDSRVVSMQFDNKHFEQNVATSMSTLDKLKAKLNFSGATKGLDNLSAATQQVDFSKMESTACQAGFRIQDVFLKLSNVLEYQVARKIIDLGEKMANALAGFESAKAGFNEYELKMNSIQTIMASTGETLETVNGYLEELNKYSDQTIYSFSDMTQNIGKFTNAGVKLEDAVAAIKGISNEAAVSGANANEASRAMYNFAQALSAGYVKLLDWKSIELANMSTVEFKNQLIATAVELGTVTESADGMYKTLEGNAFNATKNFNEVLQDQWMTSEVLITTLKKYSDETTEIGKKASDAATQVKTFTQLWDTLKESAQSGWAKTWELIVGDLEEAKSLLTSISKVVGGFIDKISNARNNLIEKVLGTPFAKGTMILIESMMGQAKSVSELLSNITGSMEALDEMAQRVIQGDFGNGAQRIAAFNQQGWNYAKVQNRVNELLGSSVRHLVQEADARNESLNSLVKMTDAQLKAMGYTEQEIADLRKISLYADKMGMSAEEAAADLIMEADALEKLTGFRKKDIVALMKMTEEELRAAGYNEESIQALKELAKYSEMTGISVEELAEDMSLLEGRTLLLNSFKNIGAGLAQVFEMIKKAWQDIFPPKTTEERAAGIYKLIASFHKFTLKLKLNNDTADKLRRTFKGLFALIDIILTVVGGPLKIAFKILMEILAMFDLDILDLTASIGDVLVMFRDWIKENNFLVKGLQWLAPIIKAVVQAIIDFVNSINFTRILADIIAHVRVAADAFYEWFQGLKDAENIPLYILQGFVKLAKGLGGLVLAAFRGVGNVLAQLISKIPGGTKVLEALGKAFAWVSEFVKKSVQPIKDWIAGIKDAENIPKYIFQGLINGLKNIGAAIGKVFGSIGNAIVEALRKIPGFDRIVDTFLEGFGTVKSRIKSIVESIGGWFEGLKDAENIPHYIFQGLIGGLKSGISLLWDAAIGIGKTILEAIKTFLGIHSPSTVMIAMGGFIIAGLVLGIKNGLPEVFKTLGDGIKKLIEMIKSWGGTEEIEDDVSDTEDTAEKFGAKFVEGVRTIVNGIKSIASGVWDFLGVVWEKFRAFAEDIDFGALIIIAAIGGIVAALVLLSNALSGLGRLGAGLGDMLEEFGDAAKTVAKGAKNWLNSKAMLNFAEAVAILAMALVVLGYLDPKNLWHAVGALTALVILLGGLMLLSTHCTKDLDKNGVKVIQQYTRMLITFSASILMLAVAARILEGITWGDLGKTGAAIAALGVIALLLARQADKVKSPKRIENASNLLAKTGMAILLIAVAAKIMGSLEWDEVDRAETVLGAILAFLGLLMWATNFMSKQKLSKYGSEFDDSANFVKKAAGAVLLIAIAAKIMGSLEWDEVARAGTVLGAILAFLGLLMWATNFMSKRKSSKYGSEFDDSANFVKKAAGAVLLIAIAAKIMGSLEWDEVDRAETVLGAILAFLGLLMWATNFMSKRKSSKYGSEFDDSTNFVMKAAGAVLLMAIAAKIMSGLEWGDVGKVVVLVITFGVVIGALMWFINTFAENDTVFNKMGTTLLAATASILIMALAAKLVDSISDKGFWKALALVTVFGFIVAGLIFVTKYAGVADMQKTMIGIAIAIGTLTLCLALLTLIDPKKLIAPTIALGSVILALAVVMSQAGKLKKSVGGLIMLSIILALVAGILVLLSKVTTPGSALASAAAIALVLAALSIPLFALKKLNMTKTESDKYKRALVALAGVVAALGVVAVALLVMSYTKNALGNAALLTGMLVVMMVVVYALKKLNFTKSDGEKINRGVEALLRVMIVVAALAATLLVMSFAKNTVSNALGLTLMLGAMTAVVYALKKMNFTKSEGEKINQGVKALLKVMIVVAALAATLLVMSFATNAVNNALGLAVMLGAMTVVIYALKALNLNKSDGEKINQGVKALLKIMIAVAALAAALLIMSFATNVVNNALALTAMLYAMAALIYILKPLGSSATEAKKSVGLLALMAIPLLLLAFTLAAMSGVQNALKNASVLTLLMGVMAGVLWILGSLKSQVAYALVGVIGMIGLAVALNLMVKSLQGMSGVSWGDIGKGLVILAGALVILAIAGYGLSSVIGVIIGFAAALVLIGLSIVLAGAGLQMFAKGFTMLAETLSANTTTVLTNLKVLIAGFLDILEMAVVRLFEIYAQFIEGSGNAIITLCNMIVQAAPAIGEALVVLFGALLDTAMTLMPKIIEYLVMLISGIIDAIATLGPELLELAVLLITTFCNGLQEAVPIIVDTIVIIVNAVMDALEILIPRYVQYVSDVFTAILEAIRTLVPIFIQTGLEILTAILQGIRDGIYLLVTAAAEIIVAFLDGLGQAFGMVVDAAFRLIITFIEGLAAAIDDNSQALYDAIEKLVIAIINLILGFHTMFADIGCKIIDIFAGGMGDGEGESTSVMGRILSSIKSKITGKFAEFKSVGEKLLTKVKDGIAEMKESIKSTMGSIVTSMKEGLLSKWEELKTAGKDLINGFKEGITSKIEEVKDAAAGVCSGAVDKVKEWLGINSPSKVFIGIGRWTVEGFAVGLRKYASRASDSAASMGDGAVNAINGSLAGISDAINADIDSQPTIRPVLDLTDVETKAGRIGGLLGGQTLTVGSRSAGVISSMMNLRSQNGVNDDVISALDRLGDKLGGARGDTYQINGVTYDDGSNITAFAEAIVRQARIGRRV